MAKSLQEQLRQAGLANQKQMVKARKAKNTKEKMQRKGVDVVDEAAELVKQRDAEILARDQALNKEKHLASERKAIQAQILQLTQMNAVTERGEVEFRFDDKGVIKTRMVSEEVRKAIIRGALAIVGQSDDLTIVPAQVARKIAERDPGWIILQNTRDESTPENSEHEDDYAGYEVPDDLMW